MVLTTPLLKGQEKIISVVPAEFNTKVQPLLDQNWRVKHLAMNNYGVVIVLTPPPDWFRKPVPGGLEEKRTKMFETKPEKTKP